MAYSTSISPSSNPAIPLHSLTPSSKSTTTTTQNPFLDPGPESHTDPTMPPTTSPPFTPTITLEISTLGKTPLSLPLPPSELATTILDVKGHRRYVSIRYKRCSGSCALISVEDERCVARTEYRFSPGRPPRITLCEGQSGGGDGEDGEVLEIESVGAFSRDSKFIFKEWVWEWRYADKSERKEAETQVGGGGMGTVDSLLVLECVGWDKDGGGKGKEGRVKVAQLVRGKRTRTVGSGKWSAGNGGVLEICVGGGVGDTGERITEVVVVSTVLVMLKKEIDKMRCLRMAAMSGGGG